MMDSPRKAGTEMNCIAKFFLPALIVGFCSLFIAQSALYGQGGVGIRAGASIDPDQFYFGGHLDVGPVVEQLWFRPNLEIGLGSNRTLVGVNFEFAYWLPLSDTPWKLYLGGGPAVNIIRSDQDRPGRLSGNTDVEGGFNLLVGFAHQEGFFTEVKVGALDSPELKIGVGYSFR